MNGKQLLKETLTKSGAYFDMTVNAEKKQAIRTFLETVAPASSQKSNEFYLLSNGTVYLAKFTPQLVSIGPVKISKPVSFIQL